jgi:hypothetical protein
MLGPVSAPKHARNQTFGYFLILMKIWHEDTHLNLLSLEERLLTVFACVWCAKGS